MNKYVKNFLQRGLAFGGFGPVILAIIYAILEKTLPDFTITGYEICLGIISTYILAFVQAGVTVFNQIEHWSLPKSLFFHFTSLFAAYSLCYVANSWIPFEPKVLLIFSLIFIAVYFAVWITVFICTKVLSKKLNKKL